jgi:uncharacterized protein (TIRG00374 family)
MKIKKYLPFIGIIIFVYILFKLDIRKIFGEIGNANPDFIIVAFIFTFIYLTTQTLKWFVIARAQKTEVPFTDAFRINLISFFYGFITPSSLGVLIRAEYLKKYNNGNFGKGAGNFTLDKILDLCSLIFLGGIFSLVFSKTLSGNYLFYLLIIFIVLVTSLIVFNDKERTKKILRIFYRKLVPEKVKEKLKDGFHSFYDGMPKKRNFVVFFFFNVLNWIAFYTIFYFLGLSLGINISYFYFLAIMPIATLVGHIPITINGLGTREAVMILLFGTIGIESAKVFSMSILGILIIGIIPSLIGSFLIFKNRKNS